MEFAVTSNVILRKLAAGDADDLCEVVRRNQEWFSKYDFLAPSFSNPDEARGKKKKNPGRSCNRFLFGLWHGKDLIGLFKVNSVDQKARIADIGYWLTQSGAGKGYASMALRRLVSFCLDELRVETIRATTSTTNLASIRLLERVGFKQKAVLHGHVKIGNQPVDDFLYELEREDLRELGKI